MRVKLTEGQEMFSVATGKVDILNKESRKAVKYIKTIKGLVAVYPSGMGTLWMFDTKANAVGAKTRMENMGIRCGNNICKFVFQNGQVECVENGT